MQSALTRAARGRISLVAASGPGARGAVAATVVLHFRSKEVERRPCKSSRRRTSTVLSATPSCAPGGAPGRWRTSGTGASSRVRPRLVGPPGHRRARLGRRRKSGQGVCGCGRGPRRRGIGRRAGALPALRADGGDAGRCAARRAVFGRRRSRELSVRSGAASARARSGAARGSSPAVIQGTRRSARRMASPPMRGATSRTGGSGDRARRR